MGSVSFAYFLFAASSLSGLVGAVETCRYIPGDVGWPSQSTWSRLNETIGHRLIKTIPQASVCHRSGYAFSHFNETECQALQTEWDFPQTFEPYSGEIMNPYFQNQSCDPFTAEATPCELDNYVSYSINVTCPDDIVAGVRFSKENNVRLVIKNTGHDFLGKSTAKGGLALWMHNLKTNEVIENFTSTGYTGPAIKLGAGITGYEALEAAYSSAYRVVSGDCATVGIAGGYTQGGGHSPLINSYGMAADQVLEWQLVTADGVQLTATPTSNTDLYWALSGGGAGTFAVVLSMTVKIYPEGPVGTALLSFNGSSVDNTTYLSAVTSWWKALPTLVDTGATVTWVISGDEFAFESFTAPDKTDAQVMEMLGPFLSQLDNFSIPYTFSAGETASYYEHFNQTMGPLPYGNWPASMLFNSRFVPRSIISNESSLSNLTKTMNNIVEDTSIASWNIGCTALNVQNISHPDNAVVSYWRDAIAICIEISLWDWTIPRSEMLARKSYLADVIAPAFEKVTPGAGAYLNEADAFVYPLGSTEWQETFYGENYGRLTEIKREWDSESVFYAHTAVGSENWEVDGSGRLCRA